MNRRLQVWWTAMLPLYALLALLAAGTAQAQQRLPTEPLAIATAEGARHDFTVEMATTAEARARGLMYRRRLGPDRGMLFVYPRVNEVTMWMKNTFIPLDMLFIAPDGRIVRIAERTVPQSLRTIASGQPVKAVLEVPGGTADRLGIQAGDRVLHPVFGTSPES